MAYEACMCVKLLSCLTLCDPADCSLLGSSVQGILQAKIPEWVAMPLLQGIFPTQGSNLYFLRLLHWQAGSLPLVPAGKPAACDTTCKSSVIHMLQKLASFNRGLWPAYLESVLGSRGDSLDSLSFLYECHHHPRAVFLRSRSLAVHDREEKRGKVSYSDAGQGRYGGLLGEISTTWKLLCHFLEAVSLSFNIPRLRSWWTKL